MKALFFNSSCEWEPYNRNSQEILKFLYYLTEGESILILVSAWHPEGIAHVDLHRKSDPIIQTDQKPIGAGLFSPTRKEVESWESITMDIETPMEYREEILNFLIEHS